VWRSPWLTLALKHELRVEVNAESARQIATGIPFPASGRADVGRSKPGRRPSSSALLAYQHHDQDSEDHCLSDRCRDPHYVTFGYSLLHAMRRDRAVDHGALERTIYTPGLSHVLPVQHRQVGIKSLPPTCFAQDSFKL
jgi:hypothetical protein